MRQQPLLNMQLDAKPIDIVYTPEYIAIDIINFFKPCGKCLDPCRGDWSFYKHLPAGSDWCEIREGKDFFNYTSKVDWIISNPPYSIFSEWLDHSFKIAENVVYLIPINKPFNSSKIMRKIYKYGGIKHIYEIGPGSMLNFPVGFAVGAVHFRRNYSDGIIISFRNESKEQSIRPWI